MKRFFTKCIRWGKDIEKLELLSKEWGRMIYLIKGPKKVYKRHLNKKNSRHIDEENDTPVDVEPMEVLYNTFDKSSRDKNTKSKRKREDTERINIKPKKEEYCRVNLKKGGVLYTLPMNINGYVPYNINTLDTCEVGRIC